MVRVDFPQLIIRKAHVAIYMRVLNERKYGRTELHYIINHVDVMPMITYYERVYLQQQQRQSAIQEQIPQQIQQTQESTREAATAAMISQNHHTGLHSSTTETNYFRNFYFSNSK